MKVFLIAAKGKKKGVPIPIEYDLFLIGSGEACQLRCVHDDIGDQHCAIVTRDRKVFALDLGSGNATFVNGEVIESGHEWPMHNGDLIEVGPLKFMLQFREKALSQRDLEEWAMTCLDQNDSRKVEFARAASEDFHSQDYEEAANAAAAILDGLNAQRGVVKGRLRIAREGNTVICRINDIYLVDEGELAAIKRELQDNLKAPNSRIVIDMKHVKRMSSSAAEMFGEMRNWLGRMGSRMVFCRVRTDFIPILQSAPATHDVQIYSDKTKAMGSKW